MYPNIILNREVSRSFKDSTKNIKGLNFDLVNALLPPFLHKENCLKSQAVRGVLI